MRLNLFNSEIIVRDNYCACNGASCGQKVESPYINLYVQLTDVCNARCSFCVAKNNPHVNFDTDKFAAVIDELMRKLTIRKISFTGGEPTAAPALLNWCAEYIRQISPHTSIVVNTNGSRIKTINPELFNSIALSRHHFNDNVNRVIFHANVPDAGDIACFGDLLKSKIHLSCNLIKRHIDSADQIAKYLDHAIDIGITDIGFVALMDIGGYSSDNRISISNSGMLDDSRFFRTLTWNDEDKCECYNFSYFGSGSSVAHFYARQVLMCNGNTSLSNLVFDGQHLKDGFGSNAIIW
jgi:molybdenum cofactor biosynthesis enzyme MoaA